MEYVMAFPIVLGILVIVLVLVALLAGMIFNMLDDSMMKRNKNSSLLDKS